MNNKYYLIETYKNLKMGEDISEKELTYRYYASAEDLVDVMEVFDRLYKNNLTFKNANHFAIVLIKDNIITKIYSQAEIDKLLLLS